MAITNIDIGSAANDGTGDDLRAAGAVINANFAQVLLTGEYGLGSDSTNLVTLSDADAATNNGFYRVTSTWTGSPTAGTDATNQGYVINMVWSSTYSVQIFFGIVSTTTVQKRFKEAGSWGSWAAL